MTPDGPDDIPGPDPAEVHERSVAFIRRMDDGDLQAVGGLLGELAGPEEFAAQVVSLASLARLLLDQLPTADDDAREAALEELARVLIAAEGSQGPVRKAREPCDELVAEHAGVAELGVGVTIDLDALR